MPEHALLLEVRLLGDRYHGSRDWPPSPFRVFQALVAGAYGGRWSAEPGSDKDAAFRWLEDLPPPRTVAPATIVSNETVYYVPNNDWDAVGGDPRRVAEIRTKKTVVARILTSDAPILYAWPFDGNAPHADLVTRLAERLHTLGLGVDAAFARAEVVDWDQAEARLREHGGAVARPVDAGAGPDDRTCPTRGSLDSLKLRHAAMLSRLEVKRGQVLFRQPPKPLHRTVAYDRPSTRLLFELRPIEGTKPFRSVVQERAEHVTLAVRALIEERLRQALPHRAAEIERIVGGQHGVCRPDHRVRVVGLPSIGHRLADPSIRRVLVEIPPDCSVSATDVAWSISGQDVPALIGMDEATGEVYEQTVLAPAEDHRMLEHYGVDSTARRWHTVTPVVFPLPRARGRIGGLARTNDEDGAAIAIAAALSATGHDATNLATVRVQTEPFHLKGARADSFRSAQFEPRRLRHVELSFRDPIAGPLVLGDGQFSGFGLFMPVETPGASRPLRPESDDGRAEVARFRIDDGPSLEQALMLADVLRSALMSLAGTPSPSELSGRDERGPIRRDPAHDHAFYLPEDADDDGVIDHVLVYCRTGFSRTARRALARLTRLWCSRRASATASSEWRVALEAITAPSELRSSTILGQAKRWISVTPLLKPRYDKTRARDLDAIVATYRDQILREWGQRFPGRPTPRVEPVTNASGFVSSRGAVADRFVRTRRGRGGPQPDVHGGFFRLVLPSPVAGPIALGKHAHFGMGLFRCDVAPTTTEPASASTSGSASASGKDAR